MTMHRIGKQLLSAVLAAAMLIGTPAPVGAASLFEKQSTETIAEGVTYQEILRFGDQGWTNIHVIRKDLQNEGSGLSLAFSGSGVSTRETVPVMAARTERPVAGINADFFYLTKPDSPLGIMVEDGKLISSPVLVKPYNALTVLTDGQASFGPWTCSLKISNGKGLEFPVQAFNKITWNYRMMTVLDRNWGAMTPGAAADYPDLVEVVVVDDRIQEIRQGQPAVAIPADGFVVLASDAQGQLLAQNFRVGDTLTFDTGTGLTKVDVAVGGGTMLVRDGQITPFVEPVTGTSSRTAIGTNGTGDQLILATVDGRHTSYRGMDNAQMAALMIELGARNAMMMDGGGSTTMVRQALGTDTLEQVTYASDGQLRPVINSLVVTASEATGKLAGVLINSGQEAAFVESPVALKLMGYDTAYQPMEIPQNEVKYTVTSGKGRIEGGKLIPMASGTLTVEASYQGKTATETLKVLSDLAALELSLSQSAVSPGTQVPLTVTGIDRNGYRAALDSAAVTFSDDARLGTFSQGVWSAGLQEGTTVLRASFGGLRASAAAAVGSKRTPVGKLDSFGYAFLSYPQEVTGQVSVSPEGHSSGNAARLDYDLTAGSGTTAAYLTFANNGIPLTSRPQKISVWVKAERTTPHWIRGQIRDGNGTVQTIEFKQGVDWTGWKRLEATVPAGLVMPAALERLYVVEPGTYKTRGTLLFDDLELLNPLSLPTLSAEEKGGVLKDALNQKPADISKQWLVYGGSADAGLMSRVAGTLGGAYEMGLFTGAFDNAALSQTGKTVAGTNGGYAQADRGDDLLVFLNDQNDGLRKSDYNQWPWLKSLLENTGKKNVLVFLQKPIWGSAGFTDKLEADLLGSQLSALAERGTNVYVFYGGGSVTAQTRDGVRYIGTGTEKDQYVSLFRSGDRFYYTFETLKNGQ